MRKQGLAAVVVAAALGGCSGDATYLEDLPGYEAAHEQAAVHCMRFGPGSGHFALYRTTCVEAETRRSLVAAGHDEAEHLPWQKDRHAEAAGQTRAGR